MKTNNKNTFIAFLLSILAVLAGALTIDLTSLFVSGVSLIVVGSLALLILILGLSEQNRLS